MVTKEFCWFRIVQYVVELSNLWESKNIFKQTDLKNIMTWFFLLLFYLLIQNQAFWSLKNTKFANGFQHCTNLTKKSFWKLSGLLCRVWFWTGKWVELNLWTSQSGITFKCPLSLSLSAWKINGLAHYLAKQFDVKDFSKGFSLFSPKSFINKIW